MAIDVDDLRTEVNATAADDDTLTNCVLVASALLTQYVGDAVADVPEVIFDKAWLAVGVELFNQRQAPNGVLNVQSYADDGSPTSLPIRISADPMRPAYPLLAPWLLPVTFA